MLNVAPEDWQRSAACRGPRAELFFPPNTPERREERMDREHAAKRICADCAVQGPCLDFAIKIREPHGIWGGLNEHERRLLNP